MQVVTLARAFARTQRTAFINGDIVAVMLTPEAGIRLALAKFRPGPATLEFARSIGERLVLRGELEVGATPAETKRFGRLHASVAPNASLVADDVHFSRSDAPDIRFGGGEWRLASPEWGPGEARAVDHMNEDHVESMVHILRFSHGVAAHAPRLVAADPEGLLIEAGGTLYHAPFDEPAYAREALHHATVRLARAARGAPPT